LVTRIAVGGVILAVIIAGVFAAQVLAVAKQQETARLTLRSQHTLAVAGDLERLVVDIETGERGYLLTGQEQFLEPLENARADYSSIAAELRDSVTGPARKRQVEQLLQGVNSYINEYSLPVLSDARSGEPSAHSAATLEDGKRRLDALRAQFERFSDSQRALEARHAHQSEVLARRTVLLGILGAVGSILVIAAYVLYLRRFFVRPIQRAAAMSVRLSGGDLSIRIEENGPGEVGELERSFNTMGRSLERNRDALAEVIAEQTTLRRVATLVAQRTRADSLFTAVTAEVGTLFGARLVRLVRFEIDGSVSSLATWRATAPADPPGEEADAAIERVAQSVAAAGRPVQQKAGDEDNGSAGARRASTIGVPILVEGLRWGAMVAVSRRDQTADADMEARFTEFTKLLGTSIANSQARAELVASRRRIVRAVDVTRQHIERELHDSFQRKLIQLSFDLRVAEADAPAEWRWLRAEVGRAANELDGLVDQLVEISLGLHPEILTEDGLAASLRALVRRSRLPVVLDLTLTSRLPEPVEATAYHIVVEALENATSHADASSISVAVGNAAGRLTIMVRDNGSGGADPSRGTGLTGLVDRVEALGGGMVISSPSGLGTSISAWIPTEIEWP
jgi:nitrate/nitrite-specific signal transduction histidine kinase